MKISYAVVYQTFQQLYERLIKAGYAKSDEEFREITSFFLKNAKG